MNNESSKKTQRYCAICGTPIPSISCKKYCSTACARKAEASRSIKKIKERAQRIAPWKDKVYAIFGWKCAVCGWTISEDDDVWTSDGKHMPGKGCEVHHIKPVKEGGRESLDNLILLCPNCHKIADAGLFTRDFLKSKSYSNEEAEERLQQAIFDIRGRMSLINGAEFLGNGWKGKPLTLSEIRLLEGGKTFALSYKKKMKESGLVYKEAE